MCDKCNQDEHAIDAAIAEQHKGVCPKCAGPTNVLLFMGAQPDGYICPVCNIWISPTGELLATVIS